MEAKLEREVIRRYRDDGWPILRVAAVTKVSPWTVRKLLTDNRIPIRSRGRPAFTEAQWKERREIALRCRSWAEYGQKVGLSQWQNPKNDMANGVRLGCRECLDKGRDPPRASTRHLSLGDAGQIVLCDEDYKIVKKRRRKEAS